MASAQLTTTGGAGDVTDYAYDPNGIKVQAATSGGGTTNLLIDPNNPTGYAQVFEEHLDPDGDGALPASLSRSYVIGDDVLTQAASAGGGGAVHHLLYDGHGSTRALSLDTAPATLDANNSYDYDAYGNALGFDAKIAVTSLLYAGEYLAAAANQYYLRARHYDTASGRFNRLDPFKGRILDPQSLHKYAYTHSDPINNIDPSGMLSILNVMFTVSTIAFIGGIYIGTIAAGGKKIDAVLNSTFFLAGTLLALASGGPLGAIKVWVMALINALADYISDQVEDLIKYGTVSINFTKSDARKFFNRFSQSVLWGGVGAFTGGFINAEAEALGLVVGAGISGLWELAKTTFKSFMVAKTASETFQVMANLVLNLIFIGLEGAALYVALTKGFSGKDVDVVIGAAGAAISGYYKGLASGFLQTDPI